MKRKQVLSVITQAAYDWLVKPPPDSNVNRLEIWLSEGRSIEDIAERSCNPVKEALDPHFRKLGVKLPMTKLVRMVLRALAKKAHAVKVNRKPNPASDRSYIDKSGKTRKKLVLTEEDLKALPEGYRRHETSRHDDHKVPELGREAAEYVRDDWKQYDLDMVKLLKEHQEENPNMKPWLNERFLAEVVRVGPLVWCLRKILFTLVQRLGLPFGSGAWQHSKPERACVMFAKKKRCGKKALKKILEGLYAAFELDDELIEKILKGPKQFLTEARWGKETPLVISYCRGVDEVRKTGYTQRIIYFDQPGSLLFHIACMMGKPIEYIRQIGVVNHPSFLHPRKRFGRALRNKAEHYEELNDWDFDAFLKDIFTPGGYGAAPPSITRAILGMGGDFEDELSPEEMTFEQELKVLTGAFAGTPPDFMAHWFISEDGVPLMGQELYNRMYHMIEEAHKILMVEFKELSVFTDILRTFWVDVLKRTGQPPVVTAPITEYTFEPRLHQRSKDVPGFKLNVGSDDIKDFLYCPDMWFQGYAPRESGSPLPPLLVHLVEAVMMILIILSCKKDKIAVSPNMDCVGVAFGDAIRIHKHIVRAANQVHSHSVLADLLGMGNDTAWKSLALDESEDEIFRIG